MCSLENGLWLLRYAGRPTPKNDKKMEQKNGHKRKILTLQIKKGNAEREREKQIRKNDIQSIKIIRKIIYENK